MPTYQPIGTGGSHEGKRKPRAAAAGKPPQPFRTQHTVLPRVPTHARPPAAEVMALDLGRGWRVALEVLLVVAIVAGIQAWRARDLLPAGERMAAPPFELLDLDGQAWDSATLRGKPAVIYFFAPWCGVCAASSPQLRWFHRWRGDEVQVLLVGLDHSAPGELREYARRHELAMPVLVGDTATGAAYRIRGYPTYYVIDSQGRIARRDFGFTTVAGLWLRTLGL